MVKRPGFFKFYIPSLGEENLKIPSRFIQSIQGTWLMNLALRDRYNNLWQVKVEMVGGDWYFTDGWTKFADENMIKGGDLLVYEYFSQGLLDFKVHGGSACLTKGIKGQKTKKMKEQIIKIESDDDVVHTVENDYDPIPTDKEESWRDDYHEGERAMDDDAVDNDYDHRTEEENRQDDHAQVEQVMDDDDHSVPKTEEGNHRFAFFKAVEVTDDNSDGRDCSPTAEEANQGDAYPVGKEVMNGCNNVQSTREVDQERTQQEGPRNNNPQSELARAGTTSSSKRKLKRDFDWYGVEILKTGLFSQPKNPYFVTKKRRHRAGELYIPMDVIKCYNLTLPEEMLLLDPLGRQFRARRKIWSDERTFYVGGWKALCGMNMVEDEDSCICEFVQNGDVFCINVSFFPPKKQL